MKSHPKKIRYEQQFGIEHEGLSCECSLCVFQQILVEMPYTASQNEPLVLQIFQMVKNFMNKPSHPYPLMKHGQRIHGCIFNEKIMIENNCHANISPPSQCQKCVAKNPHIFQTVISFTFYFNNF